METTCDIVPMTTPQKHLNQRGELMSGKSFCVAVLAIAVVASQSSAAKPKKKPFQSRPSFRTQFGTGDIPPLKSCMEFSKETGTWVWLKDSPGFTKDKIKNDGSRVTESMTRGPVAFAFGKNASFVAQFNVTTITRNRFGRTTKTVVGYTRKGTWKLEYRKPTAAECKQLEISEDVDALLHFLTMNYVGNDDDNGVFRELHAAGSANGTNHFVMYEHRDPNIKDSIPVSRLNTLSWVELSTFYSNVWPNSGIKDGRNYLRIMTLVHGQ
jgi:hypothetical protein